MAKERCISRLSRVQSGAMAQFDLEKTALVLALLEVPSEARDDRWRARFYEAVVDASFASPLDQVIRGPDGFPYFVLQTPPEGTEFSPFCISHVLTHCTDHGIGIVLNPGPQSADWVFTFGSLWALRAYGRFEGDPGDEQGDPLSKEEVLPVDRSVIVGSPSEEYLPGFARAALRGFLRQALGVKEPQVFLLLDPSMRPSRNLIFNVFREDFPSEADFRQVIGLLRWFLPPGRGLIGLSREAELNRALQPL
jgi:hypothetical protein